MLNNIFGGTRWGVDGNPIHGSSWKGKGTVVRVPKGSTATGNPHPEGRKPKRVRSFYSGGFAELKSATSKTIELTGLDASQENIVIMEY